MPPCSEKRDESFAQNTARSGNKYSQGCTAASLVKCYIRSECSLPLPEDSGKFSLYMIDYGRREKPVAGEGVFDFVFEQRSFFGIVKKMGVRPAGERALFLDIPKHFTWIVFDMVSVKVKRKGASVHFQFYSTTWADIALLGNNSGFLPGRQETFQCSGSAVV